MTNKRNIEIQDHEGNIYNPHTAAKVVFLEDGKNVESQLAQMATDIGGKAASNHNHDTKYLGKTAKAESAKSADAVPWNGVGSKPSTFPPSSHSHDDRYYTETEINTKFARALIDKLDVPEGSDIFRLETGVYRAIGKSYTNTPANEVWGIVIINRCIDWLSAIWINLDGSIYTLGTNKVWVRYRRQTISINAPSGTNWDIWYQHE